MHKDTIRKLILPVLRQPKHLEIDEAGTANLFYTVHVHADDMARMVGSKGANIQALKVLVVEMGRRAGKSMTLTLADPRERGAATANRSVPLSPSWKPATVVEPLVAYLRACGLPEEVNATPGDEGWRLALCCTIPKTTKAALNRWVAVLALSTGGRAFVDANETAAAA